MKIKIKINEIFNPLSLSQETLKTREKKIGKFFNAESKDYAKKHHEKGIPSTAQDHVDQVKATGITSVIDVGSGPGSVLIEMLKNGVQIGVGIDLAKEMNMAARNRLKEANIDEARFKILDGSFLELNKDNFPKISDEYDAISLHRVICCHPDRQGMLEQSIFFRPKIIVLTVPRTWVFLRVIIGIYGLVSKLTRGFRPYAHSQKSIDKQLAGHGYMLNLRKKTFWWVMSSYKLEK